MEIKINKEIRSYKETVYFGLTARQLICSLLAVGTAVGCTSPCGRVRPRDAGVAVHRGCCTYGGGWLLPLQRSDAGAIPVGMVQDQLSAGRSAAVAQRELPI